MADPTLAPLRRERLRQLFVEYGALGFAVHYAIYLLVLGGFVLAMRRGDAAVANAGQGSALGVWAAAYLATKLTLPVRLLGTLTLTPLVRNVWRRVRKPASRAAEVAPSSEAALPAGTAVGTSPPDETAH